MICYSCLYYYGAAGIVMEGSSSSSFETVENKKLKQHLEDHISTLPDSIIHHILSFLPSREVVRTSILSKKWKSRWCGVPNLIFDSTGMPDELSSIFIDDTINHYGPYHIQKFHMRLGAHIVKNDPHLDEKLHFPVSRHVKELILEFPNSNVQLPESLFAHCSLQKLQTLGCALKPIKRVKWECLKELNMERCRLTNAAVEYIICGIPSLEALNITHCSGFSQLVIESTSLKKLELGHLCGISLLKISCSNLEEFNLHGLLGVATAQFTNLSSLIRAALDFAHGRGVFEEGLPKRILQLVQHVQELTLGRQFMEDMQHTARHRPDLLLLSLKNTCLTLDSPFIGDFRDGVEYVLYSTPFLEKLVITKDFIVKIGDYVPYEGDGQNDYFWSFDRIDVECMESHLKLVEVVGLSESDYDCTYVLDFIGFVLRTSRVLEKVVVMLDGGGQDFKDQVFETLITYPRRSRTVVVEVLGSE